MVQSVFDRFITSNAQHEKVKVVDKESTNLKRSWVKYFATSKKRFTTRSISPKKRQTRSVSPPSRSSKSHIESVRPFKSEEGLSRFSSAANLQLSQDGEPLLMTSSSSSEITQVKRKRPLTLRKSISLEFHLRGMQGSLPETLKTSPQQKKTVARSPRALRFSSIWHLKDSAVHVPGEKGYLHMKEQTENKWKKRWIVITEMYLNVYKSHYYSKKKFSTRLEYIEGISTLPEPKDVKEDVCFSLICREPHSRSLLTKFNFQAATTQVRDAWIRSIEQRITEHHNEEPFEGSQPTAIPIINQKRTTDKKFEALPRSSSNQVSTTSM